VDNPVADRATAACPGLPGNSRQAPTAAAVVRPFCRLVISIPPPYSHDNPG